MAAAFVDANVVVRLFAADHPELQERSAQLFSRAERGEVELWAEATTVFDAYFVLTSPRLYRMPAGDAAAALARLYEGGALKSKDQEVLLRALELAPRLRSLGDAMIAAAMEATGTRTLYSFDRGFDQLDWLERVEP
jgi:predicted nucleic acid-binding protein